MSLVLGGTDRMASASDRTHPASVQPSRMLITATEPMSGTPRASPMTSGSRYIAPPNRITTTESNPIIVKVLSLRRDGQDGVAAQRRQRRGGVAPVTARWRDDLPIGAGPLHLDPGDCAHRDALTARSRADNVDGGVRRAVGLPPERFLGDVAAAQRLACRHAPGPALLAVAGLAACEQRGSGRPTDHLISDGGPEDPRSPLRI